MDKDNAGWGMGEQDKEKRSNLHNFKTGPPFYLMFYIFLLIGQAQNISSQHLTACQHSNTS